MHACYILLWLAMQSIKTVELLHADLCRLVWSTLMSRLAGAYGSSFRPDAPIWRGVIRCGQWYSSLDR
jgi:hypothetical protein